MYDYNQEIINECKARRKTLRKKGMMSCNEWRFNDGGSAECYSASMDEIYDAYYESKRYDEF